MTCIKHTVRACQPIYTNVTHYYCYDWLRAPQKDITPEGRHRLPGPLGPPLWAPPGTPQHLHGPARKGGPAVPAQELGGQGSGQRLRNVAPRACAGKGSPRHLHFCFLQDQLPRAPPWMRPLPGLGSGGVGMGGCGPSLSACPSHGLPPRRAGAMVSKGATGGCPGGRGRPRAGTHPGRWGAAAAG